MKMIDYNLLKGKITAMQSTEPEYAFNFLNNAQNPSTEWECIEDMLDSMEVHEAEPVKHGKWEYYKNNGIFDTHRCTLCGEKYEMYMDIEPTTIYKYCPNCGALMND